VNDRSGNVRDLSGLPASVQSPNLGDESLAVLVVSKADVRSVALVVEEDERPHVLADVREDLAGCGSYCTGHCRLGVAVELCKLTVNTLRAASAVAVTVKASS
jgi:hypothetical protein